MRNALLVVLAVWLLVAGADGATWRIAQIQSGDPDEYELSRCLGWVEAEYKYPESGLPSCSQSRVECERHPKNQELKTDVSDTLRKKHQRLVINFSGSLFFLEK